MEHRTRLIRRLAAFVLVLFELVGCDDAGSLDSSASTSADGGASPGISGGSSSSGLAAVEWCDYSLCDQCGSYQPTRDQQCRTCIQLCTGPFSSTPCTSCTPLCDANACSDECSGTPTCLRHTVVFQLRGDPDPVVEGACHDLVDSNASCGRPLSSGDSDCRHLGTVYDPTTAPAAFGCFEKLPCDAAVASAYACFPGPRHGLAEWYCRETVRNGATSCDASVRDQVARYDGLVRASVATELQKCGSFEAHGVTFEGCVDSWLDAVNLFRFD